MNKFVIINGCAGVGKDTFVTLCTKISNNVKNISTVDFVKVVAKRCGWDGKKDERGRKFLSDLKDALTKYDDIPIKNILEYINTLENCIVFIHSREPEEIARLKEMLHATTLLIKNKNVTKISSNHADNFVENYNYDYVIKNNGTIEDLFEQARIFIDEVNHEA